MRLAGVDATACDQQRAVFGDAAADALGRRGISVRLAHAHEAAIQAVHGAYALMHRDEPLEPTGSSMYCVKGESEKALHGSESGY